MADKIEWGGTPGPWCVGPVDDTVVIAADGSEVAAIDGDYNEPDLWPVMEANARAIAEVPAMVQVLRKVVEWEKKVNDLDDDLQYLNAGDGWLCIEQLSEKAQAILARIDGGAKA